MEKSLRIISFYFVFLFICFSVKGQGYENFNFELGDFTNWEGYTWNYKSILDLPTSPPIEGIIPRRHEIISDTNAYDKNTDNQLRLIPPGFKYSIRLGDDKTTSDLTNRNWIQSMQYNMVVDSMNPLIIINFALVIYGHNTHPSNTEQHFKFSILDNNRNVIQSCANFDICYSGGLFKNDFQDYQGFGWKDWTTIATDLSDFIGQSVTLEFLIHDCLSPDENTLWYSCPAYAYIATSCQPLKKEQEGCKHNSDFELKAPDGFETYLWKDMNNIELANTQILSLSDSPGSVHNCEMTSITGCTSTFQIKPYKGEFSPIADFSSNFNCDSDTVQFINNSSTTNGSLSYIWDFGDGITSTETNPRKTYSNPGIHDVTLVVKDSGSGCSNSVSKKVESFLPLSVSLSGTATYCPGGSTWLKASGTSAHLLWSNGSTADSIEVSAPGGEFWVVGSSSGNNCSTDTIYQTVTEEADWNFGIDGDTILCLGEQLTLTAYGACQHEWWDGTSLSDNIVSDSGNYFCVGQNKRGCKKTANTHVIISSANADFNLSDTTIYFEGNEITATASDVSNINYVWDMGDGKDTKAGPVITHSYGYYKPSFICTLEVTNEFGCTNFSSGEIIVIPDEYFIPNVFTPNNDGINDKFMEGADIVIFDRHSKIYYQGSDGWDGTYNGQPADPDTYFYTVSFSNNGVLTPIRKGYLTLLR